MAEGDMSIDVAPLCSQFYEYHPSARHADADMDDVRWQSSQSDDIRKLLDTTRPSTKGIQRTGTLSEQYHNPFLPAPPPMSSSSSRSTLARRHNTRKSLSTRTASPSTTSSSSSMESVSRAARAEFDESLKLVVRKMNSNAYLKKRAMEKQAEKSWEDGVVAEPTRVAPTHLHSVEDGQFPRQTSLAAPSVDFSRRHDAHECDVTLHYRRADAFQGDISVQMQDVEVPGFINGSPTQKEEPLSTCSSPSFMTAVTHLSNASKPPPERGRPYGSHPLSSSRSIAQQPSHSSSASSSAPNGRLPVQTPITPPAEPVPAPAPAPYTRPKSVQPTPVTTAIPDRPPSSLRPSQSVGTRTRPLGMRPTSYTTYLSSQYAPPSVLPTKQKPFKPPSMRSALTQTTAAAAPPATVRANNPAAMLLTPAATPTSRGNRPNKATRAPSPELEVLEDDRRSSSPLQEADSSFADLEFPFSPEELDEYMPPHDD